jgi:AICAR transformylase/IMP cyclohydrolase PurH
MRALIGVANKDGIETFARELSTCGYEIIASEGTAHEPMWTGLRR